MAVIAPATSSATAQRPSAVIEVAICWTWSLLRVGRR
jgi:hypothetical protein